MSRRRKIFGNTGTNGYICLTSIHRLWKSQKTVTLKRKNTGALAAIRALCRPESLHQRKAFRDGPTQSPRWKVWKTSDRQSGVSRHLPGSTANSSSWLRLSAAALRDIRRKRSPPCSQRRRPSATYTCPSASGKSSGPPTALKNDGK